MMDLNAAVGGMGVVSIISSHGTHRFVSMSHRKSYSVARYVSPSSSPSTAFLVSSAGGNGVVDVMCPSGMSSGRLYFSPLGPS